MPRYLNSFRSPEYYEETILNQAGSVIGTLRIKPSSVLWKPRNGREFYSVTLDKFTDWMTSDATRARKVRS